MKLKFQIPAFWLCTLVIGSWVPLTSVAADKSFETFLQPLMESYCLKCHDSEKMKGDVDLSIYTSEIHMKQNAEFWRLALDLIELEEMPTEDPLPSDEERAALVEWIDAVVNNRDWEFNPHPGHVTIPRLTKTEYNHTIRDLIGVDFRAGDAFLEDGEGQSGFENDRAGLFASPSLLDNYFQAADRSLSAALALQGEKIELHRESEEMFMTEMSDPLREFPGEPGAMGYDINRGQMTLYDSIDFPHDGYYRFNVRARRINGLIGAALRIDNQLAGVVRLESAETEIYELLVFVRGGTRQVAWNIETIVFDRDMAGLTVEERRDQRPSVHVDWMEIAGPVLPDDASLRVFTESLDPAVNERTLARKSIRDFGSRAFRRPMSNGEARKFLTLFDASRRHGENYQSALKNAYTGILVSPKFFYRPEPFDRKAPRRNGAHRLDPYAFASRLSYFLWMSMPDDELFALAESSQIFEPDILRAQVTRMIKDRRSRDFAELFLGQWLGFRALGKSMIPDERMYPQYTQAINDAMKAEPVLLFESLLQDGGSILELLDSPRTFMNGDLAELYEINGVDGPTMREVSLSDPKRGGLVGMGSILAATSTPTRTSPVLRGVWVLEKLLGQRIPPPPPNVAALPSDSANKPPRNLREELEAHRSQAGCIDCHQKIDPIGFGLENFDAIGRYRESYGEAPIDSIGILPDGNSFNGPVELKRYLIDHRSDDFVRNVSEHLFVFALGRKLGPHDEPSIDAICRSLADHNFEAIRLSEEIVFSFPFQYHTDNPLDSI